MKIVKVKHWIWIAHVYSISIFYVHHTMGDSGELRIKLKVLSQCDINNFIAAKESWRDDEGYMYVRAAGKGDNVYFHWMCGGGEFFVVAVDRML